MKNINATGEQTMARMLRAEEIPDEFYSPTSTHDELRSDLVEFLFEYAAALGITEFDDEMTENWANMLICFLETGE